MASVFKKTRDKKKKHACWYVAYSDENGKRRTTKGFTDKGLTEQLAAKLDNEVMLRKRGLIDPAQEKLATQRNNSIQNHLAAFKSSLGKNTGKHVKLTMSRVLKVVDGCGFKTLGEIEPESIETFLVNVQAKEKFGHRTYNHYIQAIDSFCNWCVQTKRLIANPLLELERLNPATDVRHKRRALTSDEFNQLLASARASGVSIQEYDGETRARIYTISYMTGLRRAEIASLTPRSFQLDTPQPILSVAAANSKHRREDTLPIHTALVEMLRGWLVGLAPDQVLFPKLAKRRTWLMVKKDLERVGIPYVTPEGIADFHAAGRHTHITELLRTGASVPEAMELARHSDVKMTMKYAHIGIQDQARALASLPTPKNAADPVTKKEEPEDDPPESGQRLGSDSGVFDRLSVAPIGTCGCDEGEVQKRQNPCGDRGSDVDCPDLSPDVSDDFQWRRRESNPRPVMFPRFHLRA